MSTTPQPPAPSKWAKDLFIAASDAYDKSMRELDDFACKENDPISVDAAARVIDGYHAAQAETVALLEEAIYICRDDIEKLRSGRQTMRKLIELQHHLAQLKKGAP